VSSTTVRDRHRRAMEGERGRVSDRSRRWRLLPIAAGLAVALVVAMTGKLFVWPTPTSKPPRRASAVIVLAGGTGEGLTRAVTLMVNKVAPTLVIFNGHDPHWPAANALCDKPSADYTVTCPTPTPNTTRGEAEQARNLYHQNRWNLVVVVTARYHLTVARLDMDRCLNSGFVMVSSNHRYGLVTKANQVLHEWGGWLQGETVQRSC
jgi:uncharacterized SAM-binding protein YcdF (DUF218 family)